MQFLKKGNDYFSTATPHSDIDLATSQPFEHCTAITSAKTNRPQVKWYIEVGKKRVLVLRHSNVFGPAYKFSPRIVKNEQTHSQVLVKISKIIQL